MDIPIVFQDLVFSVSASSPLNFLKSRLLLTELDFEVIQIRGADFENSQFLNPSRYSIGPSMCFGPGKQTLFSIPLTGILPSRIIREALKLDCSELAQNAFILYRGGNFSHDLSPEKDGNPYSASFGTSLFAGIVHDEGASAFYHMCRTDEEDQSAYTERIWGVGIFQNRRPLF